ncbi:HTH-type transcriptional regulator EthR [Actinoplanes ianthinogenes]|uniref:HTH-type transcriptional regulator EthR n=1 Tax=Actinoplanes ianthinogenes TaxID=122358 RepID=A0ABN6CQD7_9ACTN|nr:TetR/AcrR family transcriptional regulator [Actinoplanes ianthinogenes]BCJ47438.1 HTH-type transcriptional regulator EthR [Actinoplanes ianthinogenes]GGR01772.1 HTH-type transcriptional regulator EthR [Actinoplanes ianthinogenes]
MPAIKSRRAPTKGDQREQALLGAARVVFRDKPISQVTIDELAGAAGITRSGFYFYFESKQALLAAVVDQGIAEADLEMAEWLASDGHDRAGLRRGLAAGLARWKVEGRWLREAFLAPDPGPDVMQIRARLVEQGCTLFSKRIERDARAGLTVGGPPELIAKMAVNLRSTMFADAYADPGAYDEDELLDTLTDAILRLVYGRAPGAEDRAEDSQDQGEHR